MSSFGTALVERNSVRPQSVAPATGGQSGTDLGGFDFATVTLDFTAAILAPPFCNNCVWSEKHFSQMKAVERRNALNPLN